MKENKKSKVWLIIILVIFSVIILLACIGVGCFVVYDKLINKNVENNISADVDTYFVNRKIKKLDMGDELLVSYWNGKDQTLNEKDIRGKISTYNGIKIGSSKEEVIEKFNLNRNNTQYNCEIYDSADDGTTYVVKGRFSKNIFKSDYLDCDLTFGYRDGKMLTYYEIANLEEEELEESVVTVLYSIDINGFEEDEAVNKGEVIFISIYKY